MGKMLSQSFGGESEFLLNADYSKDAFHFEKDNTNYVTTKASTGKNIVAKGTPVPSNDANCIGLALNEYDVNDDDFNGAIVVRGIVVESKLPVTLNSAAKAALQTSGIIFR